MYEINTATQAPDDFLAGDYPIIRKAIEVTAGAVIGKRTTVKLVDGKISPVIYVAETEADGATVTPAKTAEENTLEGLYGIAAEAADGGTGGVTVVVYLTGEFFESAITLPENVTSAMVKPALRKLGIFLK
jgi:hypothetical protein